MSMHCRPQSLALIAVALVGCSRGPARFVAPEVDPKAAAVEAIERYDVNGDAALSKEELRQCPGVLSKLAAYDQDGSASLDEQEIVKRISDLFKNGTGGTKLNCLITYKGKPLSGATVVLEPEPYLGGGVQTATGTTDGAGAAQLGIPPEFVPEHLRRMRSVHYGTFKVRVTHPTISIPAKYNAETELGYETEAGNPFVQYALN
jgi:hypothetical protein